VKILAIRGHNLASLARSFEIDLANGPLKDVGLFAIVGPVGAGKSTLLDALCLALFDRTPRLSNRGGTPVGDDVALQDEWLRSNDARTLLRRDATEGHAEVDFTGRDGKRYRAKWSVRRARLRADGRVQDTDMTLRDLDRNVVVASGRKTDVLAAIQLRLGLDFQQFCRSVLLAQGDFAAFLRAPAEERAKLLENLTGAEIYRRLSRSAHEKRKAVGERVARLRTELDVRQLLDEAARKALEADRVALQAEMATCELAMQLASRYVVWHETADQRRHEESEATVALETAKAADEAAEPRRMRLRRLFAARTLLPHFQLAERLRGERKASDAALLASGRALDDVRQKAVAAMRAATEAARATFGEFAEMPRIVREFPRWQATLRERVDVSSRRATRIAELPELIATANAADAEWLRKRDEMAGLEEQRRATGERAEAARAACEAPELADLASRRNRLGAERDRLRRARELAAATAARDALRTGFADLVVERSAASGRLVDARHRLEAARTAAGLAALRSKLVAGEVCPLCGATEHRLGEIHRDDAVAAAERTVAAAQQRFDLAQHAVVEREAAIALAERTLATATAAAVEQPSALGLGAAETDARAAELQAEERALEAIEERRRGAERDLRLAVQATAAIDKQVAAAQRAERGAAANAAAARAAVDAANADVQRATTMLETQGAVLGDAFAGVADWPDLLRRLDAALVDRFEHVHELERSAASAAEQFAEVQREHTKLEAAAARAAAEAKVAASEFDAEAQKNGVAIDDVVEAARLGAKALDAEARDLAALTSLVDERRAVLRERTEQRKRHEAHERPTLTAVEAREDLELARVRRGEVRDRLAEVQAQLAADDAVKKQRAEIVPRLATAERELEVWAALDDLIGSSTGDAFVVFAQSLTLEILLAEANRRLAELARRYRLEKNPIGEMDFVVVDLDLGGTRRGLQTLSGGESFLVSLALALALATLAAPRARVETLLLDEGFGTLDAQHLEAALGALDTLQATGCQVGVISHVEGIAERIGAVVEVRPEGGGQSRVTCRVR